MIYMLIPVYCILGGLVSGLLERVASAHHYALDSEERVGAMAVWPLVVFVSIAVILFYIPWKWSKGAHK